MNKLLLALLATSTLANATGSPLTGSTAQSYSESIAIQHQTQTNASTATGGSNGGNDMNFIALPSAGAAQATSGNAGNVCPVVTVVSTARGRWFNAWSDAEIGVEPARINFICVLYNNAMQTKEKSDWDAFVAYAKEQEVIAHKLMCLKSADYAKANPNCKGEK